MEGVTTNKKRIDLKNSPIINKKISTKESRYKKQVPHEKNIRYLPDLVLETKRERLFLEKETLLNEKPHYVEDSEECYII